MSLLDQRRAELARARDAAVKDRKAVADISGKVASKQRELSRTKSATRQRTLLTDLERLAKSRAAAEKSLAGHEAKVAALSKKVTEGEAAERRKTLSVEPPGRVHYVYASDSAMVSDSASVSILQQVHADVVADPVEREHDVFLSHTSEEADVAVSDELYRELKARGLDVWYDGAELRLGESLTMQIDKGIAKSRCGVILITQPFLKGRVWTERELGALVSKGQRVIPVLHGVTHKELAEYSPILTDLVGLTTERFSVGEIAEKIVLTINTD